ncbi:hypothetical protein N5F13_19190 [Comamonas thiooxydans]|uniref:hypothetical protein n=1 Tax=Comamonas thiooxydans TaxID=363952 RepID=UPI002448E03A|nr:hypothetical protein [Comamonas thiooxydans]MDH1476627.1 hypothetical protein [Comamonas thiooxydans]
MPIALVLAAGAFSVAEQVIQCSQACTVTVQHELVFPVLNLTTEEGAAISGAVLLVWAAGWAFRVLIQTLRDTDGNQPNEE